MNKRKRLNIGLSEQSKNLILNYLIEKKIKNNINKLKLEENEN